MNVKLGNEVPGVSQTAEERIAFVLSHEGFSDWLKAALKGARSRDPAAVLNDLEIMIHVLRPWATAALHTRPVCDPEEAADAATCDAC